MFLQRRYETLNMAEKMFACLAHNTAMSFGVQLILVNEGTGKQTYYALSLSLSHEGGDIPYMVTYTRTSTYVSIT